MASVEKQIRETEDEVLLSYAIKEEIPLENKLLSYDDVITKYHSLFQATAKKSLNVTTFEEINEHLHEIERIRRVTITNKKLGSIPDKIGMLVGLTSLDLSNNKLFNNLNPLIFKLSSLKVLCLQNNELSSISPEICQLQNLEELYLCNNYLQTFPPIYSLEKLAILDLSHNLISSIPESPPLIVINNDDDDDDKKCSNNNIIISDDSNNEEKNQKMEAKNEVSKWNFKELEEVYLSFNELASIPESFISDLHNLLVFDASNNRIKEIPTSFTRLYQLKELHFSNNLITEIPSSFYVLENLVTFDVSKNAMIMPPMMICSQGALPIRTYLEQYRKHEEVKSTISSSDSDLLYHSSNLASILKKRFIRQDAFWFAEGRSGGSLLDFSGLLNMMNTDQFKKRAITRSLSEPDDKNQPKNKISISISMKKRVTQSFDEFQLIPNDLDSSCFVYEPLERKPFTKIENIFLVQQIEYSAHFTNHFASKAHSNYMGFDSKSSPVILSIKKTPNENNLFEILIWTAPKTELIMVSEKDFEVKLKILSNGSTRSIIKYLKEVTPCIENVDLSVINHPIFTQLLSNFEKKLMIKGYKFGVLNLRPENKSENDMYSNVDISEEFDEFLQTIGNKVELLGMQGYSAGLDSKLQSTGKYTISSQMNEYPVIFHVAAYLPYSSENEQQLERKRHIGNDVVVIIFLEGNCKFSPDCIVSEFNHVFVVVSPLMKDNKRHYRVEVVSKFGVPIGVPPHIPNPPVFEKSDYFKHWFLTKLINLERMAYQAPMFESKIRRTRRALLLDMISEWTDIHTTRGCSKFPFKL